MPPLKVQVFQHVPFEGLGCMENWIRARGHALRFTRFHAGERHSSIQETDWLIIMGGPMGVHDEIDHPWLREEKKAIREALDAGKTILGVCLGAQLLADVLGARVAKNPEKEIGWFPVHWESGAQNAWPASVFPPVFTAFHWHGDTFDIPAGALHLARSEACRNQGFLYRENVLGLQFHPEITAETVRSWSKEWQSEIGGDKGAYVQDAETMLRGLPDIPDLNEKMIRICEGLEARTDGA